MKFQIKLPVKWPPKLPVVLIVLAVTALVAGFYSSYRDSHRSGNEPDKVETTSDVDTPDELGEEAATQGTSPETVPLTGIKPNTMPPKYPADVLDLAAWKLTLPIDTDSNGEADEVKLPALKTFTNGNFQLTKSKDGVVFKAEAAGATTKNSKYPRSELREMTNNGLQASWSTSSGTHAMTIVAAISHVPDVKQELVMAQIHDSQDDVVMVRLEKNRLFVESGGENIGDLDTNYQLNTRFTVGFVVKNNSIKILYNSTEKVLVNKSGSGYYFKAGCYTQTNTGRGDSASSYGEVILYSVDVSHS